MRDPMQIHTILNTHAPICCQTHVPNPWYENETPNADSRNHFAHKKINKKKTRNDNNYHFFFYIKIFQIKVNHMFGT